MCIRDRLIHGDKKSEKNVKHPFLWLCLAVISLASIITFIILFSNEITTAMNTGRANGGAMFSYLFAIALTMIVFHTGLAKCLVSLMLKNKKLCSHGTNTFVLRQLSGRLSANALMAGAYKSGDKPRYEHRDGDKPRRQYGDKPAYGERSFGDKPRCV